MIDGAVDDSTNVDVVNVVDSVDADDDEEEEDDATVVVAADEDDVDSVVIVHDGGTTKDFVSAELALNSNGFCRFCVK